VRIPGLLAILLLLPASLYAAEVLEARVVHTGVRYELLLRARIDAPRDNVFHTITDYRNLATINPDIEHSELLANPAAGVYVVRTDIRICILVFCKRVEQLQRMTQRDTRTIEAVMLPDGSDFRSGFARWQLSSPTPAVTELLFIENFEPDFWVPPVIGPWLIRSKMVSEFVETGRYIEAQAGAGGG